MDITIKTLTPLWTGGIDGKVDRIHETALLGSLRWWMEALVRGMGGNVCEPTEQKCSAKNGLCEVCKIFGAEGQKRRFRLEVIQGSSQPDNRISSEIKLKPYQYQYRDKSGEEKTETRTPTWYFPRDENDKPKSGTFTLKIQSLHPDFKPEVIGGLIQFIADWSALGARPQMGFGVIGIEGSRINTQPLYDWLIATVGNNTSNNTSSDLPSLQNIFLAKIQPKNSSPAFTEQDTFNLKYDLRQLFRPTAGKPDSLKHLRHFIMGTVENKRMAAKIKISRPYEENKTTVMRVWGWIPEEADVYKNGWGRKEVVDMIYQHLSKHYTLQVWREMNPQRDTVTPNESNAQTFLRSLLNL